MTKTLKTTQTTLFDFQQVKELCLPRLQEILDELGIDYREDYRSFYGPCPIHQGSKPNAFVIYKNTGIYRCFTKACHEDYGKDLFSFVRAVRGLGTNYQALKWLVKTLKIKPGIVDENFAEKASFAQLINGSNIPTATVKANLSRATVRSVLTIPSTYFIGRGYKPKTLAEFDIGDCNNPNKFFYQRAVVPVYDDTWCQTVGFVGRSIYEECPKCKLHHNKILDCPPEYHYRYSKWLNTEGFQKSQVLFNYWRAKQSIENSAVAIICEGPGDILRLHEAGFDNAVAIFGSDLSDAQMRILELSGAFTLVVLTDADEAGEKAKEVIAKKCGRLFQLKFPQIRGKDVGGMTVDDVRGMLSC